jgi:hypothetical protein
LAGIAKTLFCGHHPIDERAKLFQNALRQVLTSKSPGMVEWEARGVILAPRYCLCVVDE